MERRFQGRWIAACTANDVLAMGARPRGFALDLAVPGATDVREVDELCAGITDVLDEYGARFEGGNTDVNPHLGTVAMCWGTVGAAGVIRRRGARPGDYLAVTTELGLGWASYLLRKQGGWDRLDADSQRRLADYNLMPLAPHQAIVDTAERAPGAITSGMDLSDGLVEFLYTIIRTPGLGVRVEQHRIPEPPLLTACAQALGVPAAALAVEYGFDMPRAHGYTVAPHRWDEVASIFAGHGTPLFRIGEVTADPEVTWCGVDTAPRPLERLWDDKARRGDAISDWTAMVDKNAW